MLTFKICTLKNIYVYIYKKYLSRVQGNNYRKAAILIGINKPTSLFISLLLSERILRGETTKMEERNAYTTLKICSPRSYLFCKQGYCTLSLHKFYSLTSYDEVYSSSSTTTSTLTQKK